MKYEYTLLYIISLTLTFLGCQNLLSSKKTYLAKYCN